MNQFIALTPKQLVIKSNIKKKPNRKDLERFKVSLSHLLNSINEAETEEHNKTHIRDFLQSSFYQNNLINTKSKNDLVIFLGKDARSNAGVLIEVKQPNNKKEMVTKNDLNARAMHEVILYYLRERIEEKNDEVKQIIITNAHEWFIFDAQLFEKHFYKNSFLKKEYETWVQGGKVSSKTEHFYNEIAPKALETIDKEFEFIHFDLRDYEKYLKDQKDETKLIHLYKIFSSHNLLKEPFANDSNSLDKQFYLELLHILGLEEIKEGSKKLIDRKAIERRESGSIIENTFNKLKTSDITSHIQKPESFGKTTDEQLYNIALELCITWMNRILFLKLMEGQLVSYHNGDPSYKFLDIKIIKEYDDLHELFHEVLAVRVNDRSKDILEKFKNIPYLNSSLFEISELERNTIEINGLKDRFKLSICPHTILKENGKTIIEPLSTLHYLLKFLDAYDFASESSGDEVLEEDKRLISASVLGLIFEKINGYKEGSFFTPGFITMYMCKETLRRSVLQKFKEAKGWDCKTIEELRDKIDYQKKEARKEANEIINSIKICDPAVGSGHFLVSALNELISIKSDFGILCYRDGSRIKDYKVKIENDELVLRDVETEEQFEYRLNEKENFIDPLQKIQEALFHEKETIIENCLFGVDINQNSVNICRLRLWIELLKNAYYQTSSFNFPSVVKEEDKGGGPVLELQTLPNIDINIKQGNSLISRFKLDTDLKKALKTIKYTIEDYKSFVQGYRTAKNKDEKRNFALFIDDIKKNFRHEISTNDPKRKKLSDLAHELHTKYQTERLIDVELSEKDKKKLKVEEEKLLKEIAKRRKELDDEESGEIFRNAFEWRFEFPEVLDNDGNFVGFDVVIGNPPYIFGGNEGISIGEKKYFSDKYVSGRGKINLFTLFIDKAIEIIVKSKLGCLIVPNTFLRVTSYNYTRKYLLDNYSLIQVADFGDRVFEDAVTTAVVILFKKEKSTQNGKTEIIIGETRINEIMQKDFIGQGYVITLNKNEYSDEIFAKMNIDVNYLGDIAKELIFGVVITKNQNEVVSSTPIEGWKPFLEGKDIGSYFIRPIKKYLHYEPKLLHRARSKEVFEVPEKLLIQRITGGNKPLKVAYDNAQHYNKESINNLLLKDDTGFDIKYILALLNSKLINWFYVNRFTNESNLTVNLSKEYLSLIPIKKSDKNIQTSIIRSVDKILSSKKQNQQADTSGLEAEIDKLVYQIYGLTEEEIKIVEGT